MVVVDGDNSSIVVIVDVVLTNSSGGSRVLSGVYTNNLYFLS